MEKTGCNIICGAPTTLAVKGLMMMMTTRRLSGKWYVKAEHTHHTAQKKLNGPNI